MYVVYLTWLLDPSTGKKTSFSPKYRNPDTGHDWQTQEIPCPRTRMLGRALKTELSAIFSLHGKAASIQLGPLNIYISHPPNVTVQRHISSCFGSLFATRPLHRGDDENRLTHPDLEHQGLRHTQPDKNTMSNVGLLCVANVPRVTLIEVSRFTVCY
jgi:hypothetical protein